MTKLPYIPYFSYGEKLPVLEHGTGDPAGLGYAYETLAALLANRLESVERLLDDRAGFVREAVERKTARRPTVFISYSHKDAVWKDRLLAHLSPLRDQVAFKVWDDAQVVAGSDWYAQLQENIDRAHIAIALVSADYLASAWGEGVELPRPVAARGEAGAAPAAGHRPPLRLAGAALAAPASGLPARRGVAVGQVRERG